MGDSGGVFESALTVVDTSIAATVPFLKAGHHRDHMVYQRIARLDKEFPVTSNTELLRLMAGVVMVATFREASADACAFALGLRAALFHKRRTLPAQPEILVEADTYLQLEAEKRRPSFNDVHDDGLPVALAGQVRRLAEETELLWWVLGEYSTSLKRPASELTAPAYALIAAAEAADRTQILPPPASIDALNPRAPSGRARAARRRP